MDTEHTPGPWGIEETPDTLWIGPMRDDGRKVAAIVVYLHCGPDYRAEAVERAKANARVISAAPELLECTLNGWRMCNALILAAEQSGHPLPHDHYAVRDLPKFAAAIAKATGSAS